MAASNLDTVNLSEVEVGGTIHEDLMDRIYDLSPEDLPFSDAIGRDSSSARTKEWVHETLEAADPDNAVEEGADAVGNDVRLGVRLAAYHQISDKVVRVADRGRQVNVVGARDELLKQVMKRQKALRRDVEARLTSRKPTVAGSEGVASQTAGVGGWIGAMGFDNTDRGTTGADPVLDGPTNAGGSPTTAPTAGNKRGLTETLMKAAMKQTYVQGGNPTMLMSVPDMIDSISNYMFTSSARIATIQTDAPQGNRTTPSTGNGNSGGGVVAQGAVNIFVTNFGTVELTPNRFQPVYTAADTGDVCDVYFIDPDWWELSFLQGYETRELARTGTADNRQITVDYCLVALAENGSAVISDIKPTDPVTQ